MISAVDSSVLLDVLVNDPVHEARSAGLLRQARMEGRLIVCECVMAEIRPAFDSTPRFREFLRDLNLDYVPLGVAAAELAGECQTRYLSRGGAAKRVLPDFLIGAHARFQADRLLARDRGYLRDYFKGLLVLSG